MLEIKELYFGYKKPLLINPLNLSFEVGELVVFEGENGKGKSTLFKTISNLIPPLSGKIEYKGQSVALMTNQIGVVSTNKPQQPHLTVLNYLNFGMKVNEEVLQERVKCFYLNELLDREIVELSDGQFKRVALVRQLLKEPKILLLDEPSVFLDQKQKQLLVEVLNYEKTKRIVLVNSHDQAFVSSIADKIIRLV